MTADDDLVETRRNEIAAEIRQLAKGEMRLRRPDDERLLQTIHEIHIVDCRKEDEEFLKRFAMQAIEEAKRAFAEEAQHWPEETDCDRLDRVQAALLERGIVFWQASPCCDSCTFGELPDRIDFLAARNSGFADVVRGYAFFIEQTLPESLADDTQVDLFLGYGWLQHDESEVDPAQYERNALGIAREVCECLRDERFEVDWNGSISRKIGISLNWLRRGRLE